METRVRSHRELVVWQKAMDLVVEIYRLSSSFPPDGRFRLMSQITRAAASVPANIAEGNARGTARDYAHYIAIAKGSLAVTETFLMIAVRLQYLPERRAASAFGLIIELSKMLTRVRSRLIA